MRAAWVYERKNGRQNTTGKEDMDSLRTFQILQEENHGP